MASFDIDLKDFVSEPAGTIHGSLSSLVGKFGELGSGSDGLTGHLGELAASFGPIGVAAIIAGVAVLAFGGALLEGMHAAIEMSQERHALIATFDALGEGAGAGEKTLEMLERMSKTLPFTTSQMGTWAKSLMAAGIQGAELEKGIQAVGAATAIMGASGGAAADKMIKKLAEADAVGAKIKLDKRFLKSLADSGVSADALATELGVTPKKLATMSLSAKQLGDAMQSALLKKGKGPLEDLGMTWATISAKFHEGISSIFEGLGPEVKALMTEVQGLFGEFNKGSTVATGATGTVTGVLKTLFAVATVVVNGIHVGFLKLYILWLKVSNAISPLVKKIKDLLPAGAGIKVLTTVVKALAVVFGILALMIFVAMLPIIIMVAAVVLAIMIFFALMDAIDSLFVYLGGLASRAWDAAAGFIGGLVDGIKSGVGAVVDAIKGLAGSAIGALKSVLHLGSPSKVTMEMGGFTSEGLAQGLEAGASNVHAAAKGAGRAALKGAADGLDGSAGASGAAAKGGRGGISVVVEAGAIVIHGAADALALTEEAVSLVFERIALREGVA